jgi:hypothetical protein
MFRIDDPTAAAALPDPEAAGTEAYFTEGNPGVTSATLVRASWLNMIQEELRAIVIAAGLTPSKTTYNQILTALRSTGVFQTPAANDNSTKVATTAFVASAIAALLPPGTIIEHAGTTAPAGYLVCPTAQTNLNRTTYAALFASIGTTWGAGDGATTFGMPWFPADYAAVQANANVGTSTVGQVIAHTHVFGIKASTGAAGAAPGNGGSDAYTDNTQSTGGTANKAAGVRVLRCVKY